MTTSILPIKLQQSPEISQLELEGLIVEVNPEIEAREKLLSKRANALRAAVEKFLIAYQQSIYLSDHVNDFSPAELMQVIDSIHSYKAEANKHACVHTSVRAAFLIWVANMDIEDHGTNYSIH